MAAGSLRNELKCFLCLKIYADPITLPCGHNFCKVCIDTTWDTQAAVREKPSCPECGEHFRERPEMTLNLTLRNIVEHYLSSQTELNKSGIFCAYCDPPMPAAKTCLLCEVSLCGKHVTVHTKSPEHIMTKPTASLGVRRCSTHNRILEYYCPEDAACICVSCCLVGEHMEHKVELLNEAFEKKKEKLRNVVKELTSRRKGMEKQIQRLLTHRGEWQDKASHDTEGEKVFSRHGHNAALEMSHLIQELEIKKNELARTMQHIEELCNIEDPLVLLQDEQSDDVAYYDVMGRFDEDTNRDVPHLGDLNENLGLVPAKPTRNGSVSGVNSWVTGNDSTKILMEIKTDGNMAETGTDKGTRITGEECSKLSAPVTLVTQPVAPEYQGAKNLSDGTWFSGPLSLHAQKNGQQGTVISLEPHANQDMDLASKDKDGSRIGASTTESIPPHSVDKKKAKSLCDSWNSSLQTNKAPLPGLTATELPSTSQTVPSKKNKYLIEAPLDWAAHTLTASLYGQEAKGMAMDINTAANDVALSDDMKEAFWTKRNHRRPYTGGRFQWNQVLGTTKFQSGRHYWDLKVSESGYWVTGVAYTSIERERSESNLGSNDKSWVLFRKNNKYKVQHAGEQTELDHSTFSQRIRISLDYEAGNLCFYELNDPIVHLHTVSTCFIEPLHAAFWVGYDGRVGIIS